MPQRRRPALAAAVLLAAIVALSGCGSGADVGEEFGKDASSWLRTPRGNSCWSWRPAPRGMCPRVQGREG